MNKLSKQELKVLKYMRAGMRNREIATTMNISEKTVSTYKRRMKQRFDLNDKVNDYITVLTIVASDEAGNISENSGIHIHEGVTHTHVYIEQGVINVRSLK